MSHTAKRVIKNTFYILCAQILSRSLSTIFIIFSTRLLGVKAYGIFVLINTIILISGPITNLGIRALIIRRMSKEVDQAERIISNILFIRIVTAIVVYLCLLVYVNSYGYSDEIKELIYIAGLVIILNVITYTLESVFIAFEKLKAWGFISVGASLIFTIASIAALLLGGGLKALFIIKVGVAVGLAFIVIIVVRKRFFKFRPRLELVFSRKLLYNSLPFFVMLVISILNKKLDIMMLSFLDAPIDKLKAIGYYAPAHNILIAMMMLPKSINKALLPMVSQKIYEEHGIVQKSIEKATKLIMVTISIPVIVLTTLFSVEITRLLFGAEFSNTAVSLMILGWGYAFLALNIPTNSLIGSAKEIKQVLPLFTGTLILNLILNLLLIPKYSYVGASIATCVSLIIAFAARFYLFRTILKVSAREIFGYLKLLFILALLLAMGLLIKDHMSSHLLLLFCVAAYIVLLFIFKALDKEELGLIKKFFRKVRGKG